MEDMKDRNLNQRIILTYPYNYNLIYNTNIMMSNKIY